MKNRLLSLAILFITMSLLFISCEKEKDEMEYEVSSDEIDLFLKGSGEYTKVITNPLIKINGCDYIVEGTIEFQLNGVTEATIDFGDGTCDDLATKTIDGVSSTFSMNKTGKDGLKKVIVQPLVKTASCNYIVSGIVKFYKNGTWLATIDYGDGTCDDLATKYWDGGSKVFSLIK